MKIRDGARAPVRFVILFLLMAGIPLAVLGWAALRTLNQDRDQQAEELGKRLHTAAEAAAAELDHGLSVWEERLTAAADGDERGVPPGAAVLLFDARGVIARYGAALPYHPRVSPPPGESERVFSEIEESNEYEGNLAEAAALYRKLTDSGDPRVRAGALMRLARCLRSQERPGDALTAYGKLLTMGGVPVGSSGDPSELVARRERLKLFEKMGNVEAKDREAALLAAALTDGRFLIDRVTFDYYSALASPLTADFLEHLYPSRRKRLIQKKSVG